MKADKKKETVKPGTWVNTYIDPDLKRSFRIKCAEEGVTMSEQIVALIHEWVKS